MAEIVFQNPHTGAIKTAPVGFSWTTLLFAFFPALFRGDWKWAIIQLMLVIFTSGLSSIVFAFIYNKFYIKDLIGSGFKVQSATGTDIKMISAQMGIEIPLLAPQQ